MANTPKVSVIIPTFNEAKYIAHSFEGLQNQTFKNFETIIVDKDSEDATRDIANRYGAKVIVEKKRGIGLARNVGARVAKGDLLVFLDADTKPHPDLLHVYNEVFDKENIAAATGPILPLEKTNRRIALGYKIVSVLLVKLSILLGNPSVCGMNFAVKKDTFHKSGGFDDKLITFEDWDLSLRLRKQGKIKYVDKAMVQTSARRIQAWGVLGYFLFHAGNVVKYYLTKKPSENYEPIR